MLGQIAVRRPVGRVSLDDRGDVEVVRLGRDVLEKRARFDRERHFGIGAAIHVQSQLEVFDQVQDGKHRRLVLSLQKSGFPHFESRYKASQHPEELIAIEAGSRSRRQQLCRRRGGDRKHAGGHQLAPRRACEPTYVVTLPEPRGSSWWPTACLRSPPRRRQSCWRRERLPASIAINSSGCWLALYLLSK